LEVVSDLEELEVIETALGCFESLSNSFYLSPDVDEGFGVSGSWDLGIFKISQHETEFRARKEVHTLLEVPGVSPPIFLSQSIPFGYRFCFCLGEVKDDAVGVDTPVIELSEKLFSDPTAVKPGDGLDIKDSDLGGISGDLFITASSSRHVFINREDSRELELA
jgi:hypothetical protein